MNEYARKELQISRTDTMIPELQWLFERIAPTQESKDWIPLEAFIHQLSKKGLEIKHNKLVRRELELFKEGDKVTWPKFREAIIDAETTIERCLLDKFVVHDWNLLKEKIIELYNQVATITTGKVCHWPLI